MYLTIEDLIDRYGADELVEVTNDRVSAPVTAEELEAHVAGETSPTADTTKIVAVVERRIADAESFVMSYVGTTYNVSAFASDNVPEVIRAVTAAIARYYLHENRMTQRVHQGYEDAVAWLNTAHKGTHALGANADGSIITLRAGVTSGVKTENYPTRVFTTRDSEKRFTEGY